MALVSSRPTFCFSTPGTWSDVDSAKRHDCTVTVQPRGHLKGESPSDGLGWRFAYDFTPERRHSSGAVTAQAFITTSFLPGTICASPIDPRLDRITVTVMQEIVMESGKSVHTKSPPRSLTLPLDTPSLEMMSLVLRKGVDVSQVANIVWNWTVSFSVPSTTLSSPSTLSSPLPSNLGSRASHSDLLLQTLLGTNLVDTSFVLSTGKGAREIFGISALLRNRSPALDQILTNTTNDGTLIGWDYDEDSDLEDEDELEPTSSRLTGPDQDMQSLASRSDWSDVSSAHSNDAHASLDPMACHPILDVAYTTWKCFIEYLYVNRIEFGTIGSRGRNRRLPSPKSMYRLADKLEMEELKALALDSIRSQLTTRMIVQEVFSAFSSRYSEILDAEVAFLKDHLDDPVVSDALSSVIDVIVTGARPHAAKALKLVLASHTINA